jgi:prepilin-type N-terminal cleavage/methylation domain-containing protein
MKKMNKKGFTLVEIMIVVAIIGLLAAIGIPSIIGAYANAQDKSRLRNIADIEKAKGMLTLPTDMANGKALKTGDTPVEADLAAALNLGTTIPDSIKTIGDTVLSIGNIGTKASYGAAAQ